uniref:T-box domain-containing protein n=1 Tax=Laticauda laticaudata TaxID=8630 RepID=A0A8C5SQF9_LATLA
LCADAEGNPRRILSKIWVRRASSLNLVEGAGEPRPCLLRCDGDLSSLGPRKLISGLQRLTAGDEVADGGRKSSPGPTEEDVLPPLPPPPARYSLDGLSPERYYLQSPGPQASADLGNQCSLFPYAGAAGSAQSTSMYQAPSGARYPYGSVLTPPGSFSTAASRTPFAAAASTYQYGQGAPPGGLTMPGGAGGLRAQVFLCNRPLWLKFHRHQTEMIITKQGR